LRCAAHAREHGQRIRAPHCGIRSLNPAATASPIAKASVEAHCRGVKVEVVLDKSQRTENYSSAAFVRNEGIW
jgi:hypothetical protein